MQNAIQNIETNENLETLLTIIQQIMPGNEDVQRQLEKISKKDLKTQSF